MRVCYAEDFNGNLTSQSHQLETEDEKIARLRNLGYKRVSIQDEYDDDLYEDISLNSIPDDFTLWLVEFKETNTIAGKAKSRKQEMCIYAKTVEDASSQLEMFKILARGKISDIMCTAISQPKDNILTLVAE